MKSPVGIAIFPPKLSLPSRERGLKSYCPHTDLKLKTVAPLAGAWIEIQAQLNQAQKQAVAPLAGAWIEITVRSVQRQLYRVAPLAGAWIEISSVLLERSSRPVAPLAGAWIEIAYPSASQPCHHLSLPSRERGLKFLHQRRKIDCRGSLPSRERGLKFGDLGVEEAPVPRRSPRGSVD